MTVRVGIGAAKCARARQRRGAYSPCRSSGWRRSRRREAGRPRSARRRRGAQASTGSPNVLATARLEVLRYGSRARAAPRPRRKGRRPLAAEAGAAHASAPNASAATIAHRLGPVAREHIRLLAVEARRLALPARGRQFRQAPGGARLFDRRPERVRTVRSAGLMGGTAPREERMNTRSTVLSLERARRSRGAD